MKDTAKQCTDLMKAWGSPNGQWRPEPFKWAPARANRSSSIFERTLNSLKVACTRPRPSHWSAFAITENGERWDARDLQREQGWKGKNGIKIAERAIREVIEAGYARRGEPKNNIQSGDLRGSCLFLCAEVQTQQLSVDDGTCTGSKGSPFVRSFYSEEEAKQLEAFEPEQRKRAEEFAATATEWEKRVFADAAAMARWVIEQKEYTAKLALGFKLPPNGKPKPIPKAVQLTFEAFFEEPVQVPPENGTSTRSKTEPVQVPVSLLVREELRYSSNTVGRSVAGDRPTDKIQAAIPQELCQKLQDTASPQLLQKIANALKDAPPEKLTARILARFESITSLGMLVHLAADVYKAFHQKPPAQPSPRPRRAPVQETREEKIISLREAIDTCQVIAADLRKPPAERENMKTRLLHLHTELQTLETNGAS